MRDVKFNLDVSKQGTIQMTDFISKGSANSTRYIISLTNNGKEFSVSGYDVMLQAVKPDGTYIFIDCLKKTNRVYFVLPEQIAAALGMVRCDLFIGKSGSYSYSPQFDIVVRENAVDETNITSSNDFSALENLLNKTYEVYSLGFEDSIAEITEFNSEKDNSPITVCSNLAANKKYQVSFNVTNVQNPEFIKVARFVLQNDNNDLVKRFSIKRAIGRQTIIFDIPEDSQNLSLGFEYTAEYSEGNTPIFEISNIEVRQITDKVVNNDLTVGGNLKVGTLETEAQEVKGAINEICRNKVNSITKESTDEQYPSVKAVYDFSNDFHKENFKKGINKVKNQSFNIDRGDLIIFVDDFLFSVGSCFVFEPNQPYHASKVTIVDEVNDRGVYTTGIFNLIDFGKTQSIYFELGKKYILTVSQITGDYTLELTIAVLSSNFSISGFDGNNYLSKTNNSEYTPTADYNPATKKYVDDNSSQEHGTFTIEFLDTTFVSRIENQVCTYTLMNDKEAFIYIKFDGIAGNNPSTATPYFTGIPFAIDENIDFTPIPILYSLGLDETAVNKCINMFAYNENGGAGEITALPTEPNGSFVFVAQGVIKIK